MISNLQSFSVFLPFFSRMFLAEFSSSLDSEAISSLNELAAVSHILAVIKQGEFHTFSHVPLPREIYIIVSVCVSRKG